MDQAFRIGHGFDVHRFADESEESAVVTLCGVKIPHTKRLLAHSDGDVAVHALCDAMLGAIAAGDIGRHFPDDDERFENIDSFELLDDVYHRVRAAGYDIGNLDITLIAQAPRLSSYIGTMCERLSDALSIDIESINVKATTTERLGYAGREEGIAAHVVVLLYRNA